MSKRTSTTRTFDKEAASHQQTGSGCDEAENLDTMPRLRMVGNQLEIVGGAEAERKLMRAFRTRSRDFVRGILAQLASATMKDKNAHERELKLTLDFVIANEPRDQIETFLLAQMAVTHVMAMRYANYMVNSETIPQQDSGERIFSKSLRTFSMQMEALQRHRTLEMHALDAAREQPPEKQEARLAITDARQTPMEVLQRSDAALASIRAKRDMGQ
jgi:hypothetical protein